MNFFQIVPVLYLCVHLCANFVFGGKAWTIFQHRGLDNLYIQTRTASARTRINYAMTEDVCERLIQNRSFSRVGQNAENFQSTFRGPLTSKIGNIESYISESGFKRYVWETSDYKMAVDVFPCAAYGESEKIFSLSHGYEQDHLFFLYVYDADTNILELLGYIEREVVPLNGSNESLYLKQKNSYTKHVLQKHPEIQGQLKLDPVCSLTEVSKQRLCVLLLNSQYYKNKYVFLEKAANTDFRCEQVLLHMGQDQNKVTEYAYGCQVKTVSEPPVDATIYISRNYADYEVNTLTVEGKENGMKVLKYDKTFGNLFFIDDVYIGGGATEIERKHRRVAPGGHQVDGTSAVHTGYSSNSNHDTGLLTLYVADGLGDAGGDGGK